MREQGCVYVLYMLVEVSKGLGIHFYFITAYSLFFQTGLVLWALFGFYPSLCLGASEAAMEQTFILGT